MGSLLNNFKRKFRLSARELKTYAASELDIWMEQIQIISGSTKKERLVFICMGRARYIAAGGQCQNR